MKINGATAVLFLLLIHSAPPLLAQTMGVGEPFLEGARVWHTLASERAALAQHFSGFERRTWYQEVPRPNGASAILVYSPGAGPRPVLFGISPDRSAAWSNYALLPSPNDYSYTYQHRIAADDDGNVLLIWRDISPDGVHARLFDGEGKTMWTRPVTAIPRRTEEGDYINHLNALFWPGQGWVVSWSTFRRVAVQLLKGPTGEKQWHEEGVMLSVKRSGHNPVSLIQDTPTSIMALWYDHGGYKQPRTEPVFRAQRIAPGGSLLWSAPIVVGEAPYFSMTVPKEIKLAVLANAKVQADLYKGIAGDAVWRITEYQVIVEADGQVTTVEEEEQE